MEISDDFSLIELHPVLGDDGMRCPVNVHYQGCYDRDIPEPVGSLSSFADLARMNGQSVSYLAMDFLCDYIEHEKTLTAQIELALEEADQGKLTTYEQVAAMRARLWSRHAG